MCENLAVIEDVGVHQMMGLRSGSAATSREKRPAPAAFRTFHKCHGAHRVFFIVLRVDLSEAALVCSFSASFSRDSDLMLFFFVVCFFLLVFGLV